MKQRLTICFALMTALMAGCTKDYIFEQSVSDSNQIVFGNSADNWGKSVVYDSDNLAQMEVYAYYTAATDWENIASADDMSKFMYGQLIEKSGSSWTYSPKKYWPVEDSDQISFFAISPYGELSVSDDDSNYGKPLFDYTLAPYAEYNDDLLVGAVYDQTKTDQVTFSLQHALTRVNISARIINADLLLEDDPFNQTQVYNKDAIAYEASGEYEVEWTIKDIVFSNVHSQSRLSLDDSGNISWGETSSPVTLTASEGYTLKSIDDSDAVLTYNTTSDEVDFVGVCEDGKAIFLLPQDIDRSEDCVTLDVRINKRFKYYIDGDDLSEAPTRVADIIYSPNTIDLPTGGGEVWEAGGWLNLAFTYDVSENTTTPLTLTSNVYDYTQTDLDIAINNNVYIYSDQDEIIEVESGAATADMTFYTNYTYDLTQSMTFTQLDGSEIEAHGFVFYFDLATSDTETETDTETEASEGGIVELPVEVGSSGTTTDTDTDFDIDNYIEPVKNGDTYEIKLSDSYSFTYSLVKYTRQELGLYSNTTVGTGESSGVNKDATDSVYKLTIDINNEHLTPSDDGSYGTFSGTIGVQMLSNAGGMITKLFPITLKKYN